MPKHGGWEESGFGAMLQQRRLEAGLSQSELALRAGCGKSTVAKTEQGVQEPGWPLVLALAKALGVKVTAFVPSPGLRPPGLRTKD